MSTKESSPLHFEDEHSVQTILSTQASWHDLLPVAIFLPATLANISIWLVSIDALHSSVSEFGGGISIAIAVSATTIGLMGFYFASRSGKRTARREALRIEASRLADNFKSFAERASSNIKNDAAVNRQ